MRVIKQLPNEAFESEFLKTEWYKEVYNPVRSKFTDIVTNPDLNDFEQNLIRKGLLWAWRYPLLCGIPNDTQWYLIEIDNLQYGDLFVIRETGWEKTFGANKTLHEVAQAIRSGVPDQGVGINIVHDIKKAVRNFDFSAKLILIATTPETSHTIVEGNHRAVAFKLHELETTETSHIPTEVIAGYSQSMGQSPWLNFRN